MIGEGNHATVEINFISLVFGGNLKGSIFGGLKAKTDLPVIIEKCKNKVNSYGKDNPMFTCISNVCCLKMAALLRIIMSCLHKKCCSYVIFSLQL